MVSTVIYDTLAPESIVPVAVVGLIILLIARELGTAGEGSFAQRLGRNLGAYTLPLLIVFFFIITMAVVDVLR